LGAACLKRKHQFEKIYARLDGLTVTGEKKKGHDLNLKRILNVAAECNFILNEENLNFE